MIRSNAVTTPVVGPAAGGVERLACGEGEGSAGAVFVTVFGVGVGFASTVRVRLEGDVELLFCANSKTTATRTIEITATDLFISTPHKATEAQSKCKANLQFGLN